ncbi:MAG: HU family DNA-binding protein [Actinomycetales bacterium]
MNKAELVDAVEAKVGDRKTATEAVEAMIDTIVRAVVKGERVAISGFGTFERVARAARTGRNPRTGTPVKIRKTAVPKFKPGSAFKTFVSAPRSMPSVTAAAGVAVTSRGVGAAAAAKKTTAKKTTTAGKTAAAKKTTKAAPAKSTAKTAAAKSTAAKSTVAKSTAAKSTAAKASTAKKAPATKKAATKKATSKATPAKTTTRATAKRTAKKA